MLLRRLLGILVVLGMACGDDDTTPTLDAGADGGDAGTDAGPEGPIEMIPLTSERAFGGLTSHVDAVLDERGMWHIYGAELLDVIRVQGYLQARDRMGQMDFIRRQATGRLAEFAGSFEPSLVQVDADSRFQGHRRNAEAIWETLSADERALVQAHADGVNLHIQDLRDGRAVMPRGLVSAIPVENLSDWTPLDTLAIARLQAASLSYDANSDLSRTRNLSDWRTHVTGDADDPRVARLAGAYHDLFPFRPAREVFNQDGFPNVGTDSGTRALNPPRLRPRTSTPLIKPDVLAAAQTFFERVEARFELLFGDSFRGSNSWAVSGEHTASGAAMMANDPHLSLTSPSLFWMAHVNTRRRGGDVDVSGQMIAGTPVNILGFNESIAWGLTTSGYDVADVYLEIITPGEGRGTVELDGAQVAIGEDVEIIRNDLGVETRVVFERVPHHGLIIPGTRRACEASDPPPCEVGKDQALSVKWTGNEPTNEAGAFLDLYTARNVDDARDAFRRFEVGGQTLTVADRDGNIYYTSSVRIPVRQAGALTYDPTTTDGALPCYVLDGTGGMEWTGSYLDERYIPHQRNPARGFVATANADPVGVTADGDVLNGVDPSSTADDFYIGCDFDRGNRLARITERLEALVAGDAVTPEDMSALQNDAVSPFGRILTPMILAELTRAFEERATPGTHEDLSAAVVELEDALERVEMARDRLVAWTSFDTPAAVEGSPSADAIADSVATSIFNATMGHLMRLTFDDEFDYFHDGELNGNPRRSNLAATTMILLATRPETLVTWDADLGDSVLWDDLGTDPVESRGDRVLRAVAAALVTLEETFSSPDMSTWRWGQIHTLRLDALVPVGIFGSDPISIPVPGDPMFPHGFPRQGDRDVVDSANFGMFNFFQRDYGSGPQQRLVVEMRPDGPQAWNALPGGNSEDPDSPHHRDEMERWRRNQVSRVAFTEDEVVAAATARFRFTP
ncbi:MAG: penicillin acylase family protein [Myxococcales bacterium]|nr:penicillin acylase family protein [Myxococcales bacterium]